VKPSKNAGAPHDILVRLSVSIHEENNYGEILPSAVMEEKKLLRIRRPGRDIAIRVYNELLPQIVALINGKGEVVGN
jgi:hypothetical protein